MIETPSTKGGRSKIDGCQVLGQVSQGVAAICPSTDIDYRFARFTADTTARSDAVTIELCTPTPHSVRSPMEHST